MQTCVSGASHGDTVCIRGRTAWIVRVAKHAAVPRAFLLPSCFETSKSVSPSSKKQWHSSYEHSIPHDYEC